MMKKQTLVLSLLIAYCTKNGGAFVISNHVNPRSGASCRVGLAVTTSLSGTTTDDDDGAILSLPMFINESVELSKRPATAMSPQDMILIAKRFLASKGGLGGDPAMLSSSFTFEGPVVGPFSKEEFLKAIGSVDFAAAFPNFVSEFYGFHVDPFEGDRVWYTARGKGKNTGPLLPFVPEKSGTGKMLVNPPQVCSITIDHSTGLISKYTIGYVVDRTIGNTEGLGGLYGVLYALGRPLPFPEANPW
eukprot:CAMPEP_0198249930 /NCGR_PEP_ID=MMETSP1447-20131203/1291_1 /TAXON_ID=420782 /ORGANISM="Chaetoceros dichaeta, Strain CCMP1751" /LENGTH=245 /DNA_ID=CAMNT_0043934671 /DNA_START=48 /DNA_END=782 /DNA_ORIENTATION=+